jgi:ribose-phosphate pyrophosphokinase
LSGKAIDNLNNSALDKLVVTDTIQLREAAKACDRIEVVSMASLMAEAIRRVSEEESLSEMFV